MGPVLGMSLVASAELIGSAPTAGAASLADWLQNAIVGTLYVGLLVAAVTLLGWLIFSRRDPLARAPQPWHDLQPESLLGAMLVYFVVSSLLLLLLPAANDASLTDETVAEPAAAASAPAEEPWDALVGLVVTNVATLVGTGACLTIARRRFGGGLRAFVLGHVPVGRGALVTLWAAVCAAGVCAAVLTATGELIQWIAPAFQFEEHPVLDTLKSHPADQLAVGLAWLGAVVIAPLAEETFFRGLLQSYLARLTGRRWLAILLAATAFVLVHSQVHVLPALLVLAVVLGLAYEYTGALWVPVVIHALFNLRTMLEVSLGAGAAG